MDFRNWRKRLNINVPVPVQQIFLSVQFRFRFDALKKLWFRFGLGSCKQTVTSGIRFWFGFSSTPSNKYDRSRSLTLRKENFAL